MMPRLALEDHLLNLATVSGEFSNDAGIQRRSLGKTAELLGEDGSQPLLISLNLRLGFQFFVFRAAAIESRISLFLERRIQQCRSWRRPWLRLEALQVFFRYGSAEHAQGQKHNAHTFSPEISFRIMFSTR